MSGERPRPLQIPLTPEIRSPSPIQLSRSTIIQKIENDGKIKQYTVSYDELTKDGELLGRGQFGVVKKMFHRPSNLTFAVKMIHDSKMDDYDGPNGKPMMDLEVPQKMGDGPYWVKFYGYLHAESCYWILNEVMDTCLHRFYLKAFELKRPMTECFLSKVASTVLNVIEYMYSLGLMHRDIKPSNILLNSSGEIKVCDFGISGVMINSVCTTINGCVKYHPPEKMDPQAIRQGFKNTSDIWSLGISLIEIATGEHPFTNAETGMWTIMNKVIYEPSPKLDPTKFKIEFCQFIDKCLVKNPDERLNSKSLLNDLFIKIYSNEPVDVHYMKTIIDEIKKDPVEV